MADSARTVQETAAKPCRSCSRMSHPELGARKWQRERGAARSGRLLVGDRRGIEFVVGPIALGPYWCSSGCDSGRCQGLCSRPPAGAAGPLTRGRARLGLSCCRCCRRCPNTRRAGSGTRRRAPGRQGQLPSRCARRLGERRELAHRTLCPRPSPDCSRRAEGGDAGRVGRAVSAYSWRGRKQGGLSGRRVAGPATV